MMYLWCLITGFFFGFYAGFIVRGGEWRLRNL